MAEIDKKYDIKFINHWDNGFHYSKVIEEKDADEETHDDD